MLYIGRTAPLDLDLELDPSLILRQEFLPRACWRLRFTLGFRGVPERPAPCVRNY